MTTESGIKRKLCRDLPREEGEAFEVWVKELLDAGHGEGDEDTAEEFLFPYEGNTQQSLFPRGEIPDRA